MDDSSRARSAVVTGLRISAFRALRSLDVPLAPVTLLTGPSGSGKSTVLEAYEALARLAGGDALAGIFAGHGGSGPGGYVPRRAGHDPGGRRGFRLGCTVDGPAGHVRFDVSVQAEPDLRIVGERLTDAAGTTLFATALRDPRRRTVEGTWHTCSGGRRARTTLPDDRLGTALLPLRVAGTTSGERRVREAAEQVVVALRSVFACDPVPEAMRAPVAAGDGLLRGTCDNVAAVLRRTRVECAIRHGLYLDALGAGWSGPVSDLITDAACGHADRGRLHGLVDRGDGRPAVPLAALGDGELRYAALALVLLTGPGVLSTDAPQEVNGADQALTVLADGLDRGLDPRQTAALLELAGRMGQRGHVRLLATVSAAGGAAGAGAGEGVGLVDLDGEQHESRRTPRPRAYR